MSSVVISGDTSGSVTLAAPSTAGSGILTLPVGTGTVSVNGLNSNIVSGTAVNASGTTIDFTSIPSWVKRITVIFNIVQSSSGSDFLVQLGYGSTPTYVTTGYAGAYSRVSNANTTTATGNSTGFGITYSATNVLSGQMILTLTGSNIWVSSFAVGYGSSTGSGGGALSLGNTLTAVRINANGGSFNAGTLNIIYE